MQFQIFQDQRFYNGLRAAAENAVEVANQLNILLSEPRRHAELCPLIKELESKGDHLTHTMFGMIHSSFFAPLEREDLASLTVAIDSVVDSMEAAAARIGIYRVQESDKFLKAFGQILRAECAELVGAIDSLAGGKMEKIRERAFQINVLENQGDEQLRHSLSNLFDQAKNDPVRFITMKEIYETLEDATDRVEDVANVLEGVVMKQA